MANRDDYLIFFRPLHWKPFDRPGIRARKRSTSSMKVGGGSQPIRTERGWFLIYFA